MDAKVYEGTAQLYLSTSRFSNVTVESLKNCSSFMIYPMAQPSAWSKQLDWFS